MEPEKFEYAMAKVFAPVRSMLAISVLMFLGVCAFAMFGPDDGKTGGFIGLAALVILGALAVFWGPLTILLVLGYGGLSMSDDGVSTYLFGKRHRQVRWSEIKRVEKVTFLDHTMGVNRVDFWLRTDKSFIRFDDYLKRYSRAVEVLNAYIKKYNIPAFEYDHGVKSSVARLLIAGTSTAPSQQWPRPGEMGKPVDSFST